MNVERQSLILVTVDCLRADHCGFHRYPRSTTPFLDTLAAESLVVPTAVVAGAPTYYSFPAILASRMPLSLGRDVVGLALGEPTLATALAETGYATAAFSAANPYISPHFGYEQGFDVFRDFLDFDPSQSGAAELRAPGARGFRGKLNQSLKRTAQTVGLGRVYDDLYFEYCMRSAPAVTNVDELRKFPTAQIIVEHAISWLNSTGQRPFFLWLHLMDPHSPYYPSAAAFRELTAREVSASEARYLNEFWNRSDLTAARLEAKKNAVIGLYDAGIRSVDVAVARLVEHLKEQRQWDKCTFVLTADHGEEFLEHGRRYHAPVSFAEEIVRVPLMIRVPALGRKVVPEAPFSHLHLAPTLLEILDVPAPPGFQGRSLWRNLQDGEPWDGVAIAECAFACTNPLRSETRLAPRLLSVRDTRHKLVLRLEAGVTEELYDLKTGVEGQRPLPVADEKEVRIRLLEAARKHVTMPRSDNDKRARLKVRLRDLRVELGHSRSRVS